MIHLFAQVLPGCSKAVSFGLLVLLLSSCQVGYLAENAYEQVSLLRQRQPIDDVLSKGKLTDEQKEKLILARKASQFASDSLALNATDNYTTYVDLKRDHVTYVVNAADPWSLNSHLWWFPIVGNMPYKGFFNPEGATREQDRLKSKGLDTFVRGVAAYSTLGWFDDPILSSMLRYKSHHLVNTVIHENVHATVFIKSSADFNERLAVFLGNKGTERFYRQMEGDDSKTLKMIEAENADDRLFSQFITRELADLKEWYQAHSDESQRNEQARQNRIAEIQKRFRDELEPQLQTQSYHYFGEIELNNARLMLYNTYVADLSSFADLYHAVDESFEKFIASCKELENSKDPEKDIHGIIARKMAEKGQVAEESGSPKVEPTSL